MIKALTKTAKALLQKEHARRVIHAAKKYDFFYVVWVVALSWGILFSAYKVIAS